MQKETMLYWRSKLGSIQSNTIMISTQKNAGTADSWALRISISNVKNSLCRHRDLNEILSNEALTNKFLYELVTDYLKVFRDSVAILRQIEVMFTIHEENSSESGVLEDDEEYNGNFGDAILDNGNIGDAILDNGNIGDDIVENGNFGYDIVENGNFGDAILDNGNIGDAILDNGNNDNYNDCNGNNDNYNDYNNIEYNYERTWEELPPLSDNTLSICVSPFRKPVDSYAQLCTSIGNDRYLVLTRFEKRSRSNTNNFCNSCHYKTTICRCRQVYASEMQAWYQGRRCLVTVQQDDRLHDLCDGRPSEVLLYYERAQFFLLVTEDSSIDECFGVIFDNAFNVSFLWIEFSRSQDLHVAPCCKLYIRAEIPDLDKYDGKIKASTITKIHTGHELWIHLEASTFPHRKFLLPIVRNLEELAGARFTNERIICESLSALENRYQGLLITIPGHKQSRVVSLGGCQAEWSNKTNEQTYYWDLQPFPACVDRLIMGSGYFYPSFKKHPEGRRKPQGRCKAGLSNPIPLLEFISWRREDSSPLLKMKELGGDIRLYGGGDGAYKSTFKRNLSDVWLLHLFQERKFGYIGCWTFFGLLPSSKKLAYSICIMSPNKAAFQDNSGYLECCKIFGDELDIG